MLGTARSASVVLDELRTLLKSGGFSTFAALLSRYPSANSHLLSCDGAQQYSNLQAPVTLEVSPTQPAQPRGRSPVDHQHVGQPAPPDCWLEPHPASFHCRGTASPSGPPPVLQPPRRSMPSFLSSSQEVTPIQPAPQISAMHSFDAQLLSPAASWINQLRAPLTAHPQQQPLLLSTATTLALPTARRLAGSCMHMQFLPAPSPAVRTLTVASQPPRVLATRKVPAPPDQKHSTHATSSSSSKTRRKTKAERPPSASSRCNALQQALELEWGSEHRLKPSQLTAGLEQYLASRPAVDLRARAAGLRDAVGLEVAVAMVRSYPRLLVAVPPRDVLPRLDAWADALGADHDSIVRLVMKKPGAAAVLTYARDSAKVKVETVCAALRVGREELLEICTKNTRVLTADHKGMPARLLALGNVLRLRPALVAEMCRRCPSALSVDAPAAEAVCGAVAAALEVGWEDAVRLCRNTPSVLCNNPHKVAEVAGWLKQHLGLWEDIGRYLFLLTASPTLLTPRLEALPAALGITREEGLRLVTEVPRLLLLSPASMAAAWAEMRRVAGMRAEWREQIGGWAPSSLTRYLHGAKRIAQRVDAVVALKLAPAHLPALSVIAVQKDEEFTVTLTKLQKGLFRSRKKREQKQKQHVQGCAAKSIQACYPGLWRQL